jgi:hypothetical protein
MAKGRSSKLRSLVASLAVLAFSTTVNAAPADPVSLAHQIDERIAAQWKAGNIKPASPADDATFVRRIYLDLAGHIPTVADARYFLADKSPERRTRLITKLVNSPSHARHAATFWRQQWIPQANAPQFALLADEIDGWLADKLREGASYDQIVRDLLTVSGSGTRGNGEHLQGMVPTAFLKASEFKPENLAANTTRAFLGLNLDCAQCHNHPFSRWTREQFWQTAAFFARPTGTGTEPLRLEIAIPDTKQTVGPKLLAGSQPGWPEALKDETGRIMLADWITAKDNPYFARNAVNRVWAELLGTGLVEPLDDLNSDNPASHPELLDDLAKAFVESGFDLKFLTTAILLSETYQRSTTAAREGSPISARLFARSAVRGLSGEQLYDSLLVAAGLPLEREDLDPLNAQRERKKFAEKFRVDRSGTAQRSILQSLSLMNGKLISELTDVASSPTLRGVSDAPFLDRKGKIESLYLAALSRPPTEDELAPLLKYVEGGSVGGNERQALADVFWALLNTSEFSTNH